MTFERAMVILFTKELRLLLQKDLRILFLIMMETERERYLHIHLVFL